MAHTKAKGTSKLGRESAAQRLGVKIFGGAKVIAGQIIIRQRGTKWHAGDGVARGGDDTLFALRDGVVKYSTKKMVAFTGNQDARRVVSVANAAE
jgi:large subunit ribosomal protein L27